MHDPLSKEEMEDFYSYLKEIERVDLLTIPSKNYDLVLDVTQIDDRRQWSYYYACHDTRCLFWLDLYDATYITSELDGVESLAHLSASQACTIAPHSHYFGGQGIAWRVFIGTWVISFEIGSLRVNVVLTGPTGLCFRLFLWVAVFRLVFMMNSWGSWYMVA